MAAADVAPTGRGIFVGCSSDEPRVFTELQPGRLEGLYSGGGPGWRRVFTDGKRLVTDGPFAETREQLGGYTLIEANDPDEAINIAAGYLGDGTTASIEVRPVVELAGSPVKAV